MQGNILELQTIQIFMFLISCIDDSLEDCTQITNNYILVKSKSLCKLALEPQPCVGATTASYWGREG